MARRTLRVALVRFQPRIGAAQRVVDIVERIAVARNHDADVEARNHVERRARRRQRGGIDLARHHEAEAVPPQRVARDQDAVLAGCRSTSAPMSWPGAASSSPVEVAPAMRACRREASRRR